MHFPFSWTLSHSSSDPAQQVIARVPDGLYLRLTRFQSILVNQESVFGGSITDDGDTKLTFNGNYEGPAAPIYFPPGSVVRLDGAPSAGTGRTIWIGYYTNDPNEV